MDLLGTKQLEPFPETIDEWLAKWNSSNVSILLDRLLEYGPCLDKHFYLPYKLIPHYLDVASGFYACEDKSKFEDNRPKLLRSPELALRRRAFEVLCNNSFAQRDCNDKQWEIYLWNKTLFDALIKFLNLNDEDNSIRSYLIYSRDCQKNLRTFLLNLALFLIQMPICRDKIYISEEEKELKIRLTPRRDIAVTIFWELNELDRLFTHKEYVDRGILKAFEKRILDDGKIPVLYKDRKKKTYISPKRVEDFLKIDPRGWFWREKTRRIKAAYLYLALT